MNNDQQPIELVADIETDGFLEETTRIWCLSVGDPETGELDGYSDHLADAPSLAEGLQRLSNAGTVWFHNGIRFDIPAIRKVVPSWTPPETRRDSLLFSQLLWPDIRKNDAKLKAGKVPRKYIGKHSLAAWGFRLGILKDEYEGGFDSFSREMFDYCNQDVEVTLALVRFIKTRSANRLSEDAIDMEHRFAELMFLQEQNGFGFDEQRAASLYAELAGKRATLEADLRELFEPWYSADKLVIPRANRKVKQQGFPFVTKKRFSKKTGKRLKDYVGPPLCEYERACRYTSIKLNVFNPGSRHHIIDRLTKLRGWEPGEFTEKGQAKVDDEILSSLPWDEAQQLAEYFLLQKRIGQISEGKNGWLKVARKGIIHGAVATVRAVTRRCTHEKPNVAQVPSIRNAKGVVPYGRECRELWKPTRRGWVQVGADLSGIELRCLAEALWPYDNGEFAKELLEGDVHSKNRDILEYPHDARQSAKTTVYAFLYGVGDYSLGVIVWTSTRPGEPLPPAAQLVTIGKRTKAKLSRGITGLGTLIKDLERSFVENDGFISAIDGALLTVRKKYSVLNTKLQSMGSIIAKRANIIAVDDLEDTGMVYGKDFAQMAMVHDEFQIETPRDNAEIVGKTTVDAMRKAGEYYGVNTPISGEFKVGANWAECH